MLIFSNILHSEQNFVGGYLNIYLVGPPTCKHYLLFLNFKHSSHHHLVVSLSTQFSMCLPSTMIDEDWGILWWINLV